MEIIASAPAQMGLSEIADWASRMERIGFDVIHIAETIHDPFTIAAMALTHTKHVTVRTSMVLAFPRSPMIVAYAAWDLAKYSSGRFQLGIASRCAATSSAASPPRGRSRCRALATTSNRCARSSTLSKRVSHSTT